MSLFVTSDVMTSDVMTSDHYSIRTVNENLTDKNTRSSCRTNWHSCKEKKCLQWGRLSSCLCPQSQNTALFFETVRGSSA